MGRRNEEMPTDVIMPQMGESIFEGTITKWLKKPGDSVQRDEPLFEISTDKVDAEIPSPASRHAFRDQSRKGNTVQINTVVAVIGEADGAAASKPPLRPHRQSRSPRRKRRRRKPPRQRLLRQLLRQQPTASAAAAPTS